ncbi:hypothetical protein EJ04DRAFT_20714 [Polyplosphaeria fusca]|uniref:Uncharacterized protein n=1 Tax=Polyplosphaeria fusca TaxID=682080 RepID=A0A9P4UWI0_9PLEO|nr:hypothetical protein EJ04DRAFT_20714 [Polyplosphaeria fusca]
MCGGGMQQVARHVISNACTLHPPSSSLLHISAAHSASPRPHPDSRYSARAIKHFLQYCTPPPDQSFPASRGNLVRTRAVPYQKHRTESRVSGYIGLLLDNPCNCAFQARKRTRHSSIPFTLSNFGAYASPCDLFRRLWGIVHGRPLARREIHILSARIDVGWIRRLTSRIVAGAECCEFVVRWMAATWMVLCSLFENWGGDWIEKAP